MMRKRNRYWRTRLVYLAQHRQNKGQNNGANNRGNKGKNLPLQRFWRNAPEYPAKPARTARDLLVFATNNSPGASRASVALRSEVNLTRRAS